MVPKFIHKDHGDFKTVQIHFPFVIQQWLDFPTEKQHIRLPDWTFPYCIGFWNICSLLACWFFPLLENSKMNASRTILGVKSESRLIW